MVHVSEFGSVQDLIRKFPDEQSCISHLEQLRWNGLVTSPFDSSSRVYDCKGSKYKCKNSGKYFNVKTATLFDNSRVPLTKWFVAIWLVNSHEEGVSSIQLSREIAVTQKTAWYMLQRLNECYRINNSRGGKNGEGIADYTGQEKRNFEGKSQYVSCDLDLKLSSLSYRRTLNDVKKCLKLVWKSWLHADTFFTGLQIFANTKRVANSMGITHLLEFNHIQFTHNQYLRLTYGKE